MPEVEMQIDPRLEDASYTAEGDSEHGPEELPDGLDEQWENEDTTTELGINPQLEGDHDPDLDLAHDRAQSKTHLRKTFEHIFHKYEKDFDGIGDEIDLRTGEIVVDNGHLRNMRYEVDTGENESTCSGQEDVEDTEYEGRESDSGSDEDDGDNDEDGDKDDANANKGRGDINGGSLTAHVRALYSSERLFAADKGNAESAVEGATETSRTPATQQSPSPTPETSLDVSNGPANNANPDSVLNSMRESMLDLQSKYQNGQNMDPDAIQALGMSIASQLASFMSNGTSKPAQASPQKPHDPTWSYPTLPKRRGEKRKARSISPAPDWTFDSPNSESIWAPMKHPRRHKRRKFQLPDDSGDDAVVQAAEDSTTQDEDAKKCTNCNFVNSAIWRNGPDGARLCNACGMYFYRYGLMRPTALDTAEEEEEEARPKTPDVSDFEDEMPGNRYSANTSRRIKSTPTGGKPNKPFAPREDVLLIELKEIYGMSWEQIGGHFPGRTAYAAQCRYAKKLRGGGVRARVVLVNQGHDFHLEKDGMIAFPKQKKKDFTDADDELLLKLRATDGLDWKTIELSFPGWKSRALERRFENLVKKYAIVTEPPKENEKSPSEQSVRLFMRYTEEEDDQIVMLREVEKLTWAEMAERIPGRGSISLQKRYVRELAGKKRPRRSDVNAEEGTAGEPSPEPEDPTADPGSRRNLPYSKFEDETLVRMKDLEGIEWELIEDALPGRNVLSLKNRYSYLRIKGYVDVTEDGGVKIQGGLRRRSRPGEKVTEDGESDGNDGGGGDAAVALVKAAGERGSRNDDGKVEVGVDATREGHVRKNDIDPALYAVENPQDPPDAEQPLLEGVRGTSSGLQGSSTTDSALTETNAERSAGPATEEDGEDSPAKAGFSEAEDKLIVKLVEHEDLSFEHVATVIKGRSVELIRSRYQELRPNTNLALRAYPLDPLMAPPTGEDSTQQDHPEAAQATKFGLRWSKKEIAIIFKLRSRKFTWDEIARRLPTRSANSIRTYWNSHRSDGTRKQKGEALLKQAVGNNVRRSVGDDKAAADGCEEGEDCSGPERLAENEGDGLATCGPNPEGFALEPATEPRNPFKPVQAEPRHAESCISPMDDEVAAPAYPKTPARDDLHPDPEPESTQPRNLSYYTPALAYHQQSHPYFIGPPVAKSSPVAPAFPAREPSQHAHDVQGLAEEAESRRAHVASKTKVEKLTEKSRRGLNEIVKPKTKRSAVSTGLKRPVGRPRKQDPVLIGRQASNSQHKAQNRKPSADASVYDIPHTDDHDHEDDYDMRPALTFDKTDEEQHIHDIEVEKERRRPRSPAPPSSRSRIWAPPELEEQPPPWTWTELVIMALKAQYPQPLMTRQIMAWVDAHFPYFSESSLQWRISIQTTISKNKDLFKRQLRSYPALWNLADYSVVSPEVEKALLELPEVQMKRMPLTATDPNAPPSRPGRPRKSVLPARDPVSIATELGPLDVEEHVDDRDDVEMPYCAEPEHEANFMTLHADIEVEQQMSSELARLPDVESSPGFHATATSAVDNNAKDQLGPFASEPCHATEQVAADPDTAQASFHSEPSCGTDTATPAVVARQAKITFELSRDPESTPGQAKAHDSFMEVEMSAQEVPLPPAEVSSSSSPLVSKHPPPAKVYGKVAEMIFSEPIAARQEESSQPSVAARVLRRETRASSLSRLESTSAEPGPEKVVTRPLRSSLGAHLLRRESRASSVARLESGKRVVNTPAPICADGSSEDELAL